jgi:hypothetical protein
MASDQDGQSRPRIQPLVDVATEGAALGYQALELVVAGLRESLRLQPSSRHAATSAAALKGRRQTDSGPSLPGRAAAGGLAADVAAIAGEMFKRAGAAADEIARVLPKQEGQERAPTPVSELAAEAAPGQTATSEFSIWNTSPMALRRIRVSATGLIGPGDAKIDEPVKFEPEIVDWIGPGKSKTVKVGVAIPHDAQAGVYRALVQAEPPDTCAVLQITVTKPEAEAPA